MKFTLISLLFFFSLYFHSSAQETHYVTGSWAEITARAKAEHKYIFIDCYTAWCSWCKEMDRETMSQPSVVRALGEQFIAVKMDMEHGEGYKLAMKYHIAGFPTFMFFDPEGRYVYKSFGFQTADEILAEMANAQDRKKQFSAPGYSSNLDVAFPDFYKKAFVEPAERKQPKPGEVDAYLGAQSNMFSEEAWGVIGRFDLNEKNKNFFFGHLDKYRQLYGDVTVNERVQLLLTAEMKKACAEKDKKAFAMVMKKVRLYMTRDTETTQLDFRISFYKAVANWAEYARAINDFILYSGYTNTNYINTLCWDLYEHCEDKKLLARACIWMKEVTSRAPSYANLDTYASLLFKSGDRSSARTAAEKAIEQGKKEEADTTATEDLLKKIKLQG